MTARTLPRLRPELKLVSWPRPAGSPERHFARDPATGDVVELGAEAAFVCRLLDGRSGVEDVCREHERQFGRRLTEEDLEALLQRLAEGGLLEGVAAEPRRKTFPELFAGSDWLPWGKVRLGEGERLIGLLSRCLGFAFTWPFHLLAAGLFLGAVWVASRQWADLLLVAASHVSPGFAVGVVLASSLLVRTGRALVHGVACKRHGRRVGEIGMAFALYVLPSLYVDWSDAARIRTRRERGWVVFSGLYFHLLLWAVAILGWRGANEGSPAEAVWVAIALASLTTFVLFTANPLAAADGYYLLANWLDLPHLRERALAAFGSWVALRPSPEHLVPRERKQFRAYGLLCFGYAVFVVGWVGWQMWGVVTGAFQGAGALAMVAVVTMLAQKPVAESLSQPAPAQRFLKPRRRLLKWAIRLGVVGIVVLLGFIPYPYETGGPFLLLPVRQTEVHTQVQGEVVRVLVSEGDLVVEGQPLALVDRREYERNYGATTEQLAAAQAKLDLALAGPKQENVVTAERRLQKAEQEVELARVRYDSSSTRAQRYEEAYKDRLVTAQEYETAIHLRDNDYQSLQVALKENSVAEAELAGVKSGARSEEIDALRAEVRSLETLQADLRQQLELTELRSPVEGRVVTPYVDQRIGHYLKTGDLFVTIEEARTIRAEVEVPEEDAAEVRGGARVRAVPWAFPSITSVGKVLAVAPAATESLQTSFGPVTDAHNLETSVVRVISEFPNPDGRLKSNMTGYAKIATHDKPLWKVLLWPLIRWIKVEVWYWIP